MKSTKDIAALDIVYTAENVMVYVRADSGSTIVITLAKSDIERVLVDAPRGVPVGIGSSATLTIPPILA